MIEISSHKSVFKTINTGILGFTNFCLLANFRSCIYVSSVIFLRVQKSSGLEMVTTKHKRNLQWFHREAMEQVLKHIALR